MKTIYGLFLIVLGTILFFGGMYIGLWMLADNITLPKPILLSFIKILFCEIPVILGIWFGLFFIGAGIKIALSREDYLR